MNIHCFLKVHPTGADYWSSGVLDIPQKPGTSLNSVQLEIQSGTDVVALRNLEVEACMLPGIYYSRQ